MSSTFPVLSEPTMPLMTKQQMIDAIRERNRTASVEYLTSFDEDDLQTYLTRLTDLIGRRGRSSVWTRDTTEPCFVHRAKLAA